MRDAWWVTLIVFVTMLLIVNALFAWILYLLRQIDLLDRELGHETERSPRGGIVH
jgi:hypothetical protein